MHDDAVRLRDVTFPHDYIGTNLLPRVLSLPSLRKEEGGPLLHRHLPESRVDDVREGDLQASRN